MLMLIHVQSYWSNFILIAFANRDQKYLCCIRANTFFFTHSLSRSSAPFAIVAPKCAALCNIDGSILEACALYRYRVSHIFFVYIASAAAAAVAVAVAVAASAIHPRTKQMRTLCVLVVELYYMKRMNEQFQSSVVVALAKRQQRVRERGERAQSAHNHLLLVALCVS